MHRFLSKLTYANVVATLALVLAVGGGATAIAMSLPKNSVKSKQIAKGAVTTKKIAKDAVTGEQVKESTLGKVPSAGHADLADKATSADSATTATSATTAQGIAGVQTTELTRVKSISSADFGDFLLDIEVPGYGFFGLSCGSEGVAFISVPDDSIEGGLESGVLTAATSASDFNPKVYTFSGKVPKGASSETIGGNPMSVTYSVTMPGSDRSLTIQGGGEGINEHCVGQIHAFYTR